MQTKTNYLQMMRDGEELNILQMIMMTIQLSMPAIMAQLSSIIMQYIDASMVGHLGAAESASIGLMASSTWLCNGLCMAVGTGFTVQIANKIGAKDEKGARSIVILGLSIALCFSLVLTLIASICSFHLPGWMGAGEDIKAYASSYFLIYALFLPFKQIHSIAGGMIQCSGNMKVPGFLEVQMCALDVIFNYVLIFPSRTVQFLGHSLWIPGAGLSVKGAALGTAFSIAITALLLLYYLLFRSDTLRIRKHEKMTVSSKVLKQWLKISIPVGAEQFVTCMAYIIFSRIVAPLGNVAIAAHSFCITVESLCYMPGYGIGVAATTIIGQCIGGKRYDLSRKMGWLITVFGMLVMTASGCLMYIFAPQMIGLLSPDEEIRMLGTTVLRIEAFAEPMYAASIVITGVFRGSGSTFITTILIFISMWLVRIPLAAWFVKGNLLPGVWTAMCLELCVRGALFILLMYLKNKRDQKKIK